MILSYALFIAAILFIQTANSTTNANNKGKLLATAATTSIEGSAGGGIVPWAVLSGYDTREQISIGSFATRVDVAAYRLDSYGLSAGLYDRIELSAAHHTFDLKRSNIAIEQDIFGAKIRLFGDIVYTEHPQISIGLQHKKLLDTNIATAVGAGTTHSGTDIYLAATKLHLGLAAGYNVLWNMNLRRTKANQLGLLGFGGDKNDDYE